MNVGLYPRYSRRETFIPSDPINYAMLYDISIKA